jgi:small GTP-binding protein
MLQPPQDKFTSELSNLDQPSEEFNEVKSLSTDCKICKTSIEFQVPVKPRDHYPFSFVYYHGQPVHATVIYIDANYKVRGSETIKEVGGQSHGPSGVLTKKCVVAGDWGVGKTSLIQRLARDQFQDSYDPTINLGIQEIEFALSEESSLKVQFWEVTGQHTSATIQLRKRVFAGADAALLICDVTRKETFEYLMELVDDVNAFAGKKCAIFAIANKIDQLGLRQVPRSTILEYQEKLKVPFFEVSLKEKTNLDESLERWLCELQQNESGGGKCQR